ncbi:MAG: hypothetical protein FWF20_02565 [Betaproteobacteria bacterium]|nr:hypothetical protein [Betaproteobacteria bacterium]MCL2885665.1 hypothetical protein [Betaproteobacteria bacterium]
MKLHAIDISLLANSISRSSEYQRAKSSSPAEETKKAEEKTKPLGPSFAQQAQSATAARKGALGQRIAQIKAQLEAMMKLPAGSISPRMLKQLASELRSIVAEYKQLSEAASSGMPNVAVNPTVAGPSGATASGDAAGAAATAAAADAAAAAAESAPAVSEAEIEQALAAAEEEAPTQAGETEKENNAPGVFPNAPNETRRETGTINAKASSGAEGDKAFFEAVKDLSRKLKFLMTLVKNAANKDEEKEIKAAKKAIADLDDTISEAEEDLAGNQPVVAGVSYEASGTAVPEIAESAPVFVSEYA